MAPWCCSWVRLKPARLAAVCEIKNVINAVRLSGRARTWASLIRRDWAGKRVGGRVYRGVSRGGGNWIRVGEWGLSGEPLRVR